MAEQTKGATTKLDLKLHNDLPREEIMDMAEEILQRNNHARVYFKYTCPHCGERCSFTEPNVLWEEGECCKCSKVSSIDKAGFMLVLDIKHPPNKGLHNGSGAGTGRK